MTLASMVKLKEALSGTVSLFSLVYSMYFSPVEISKGEAHCTRFLPAQQL